MKLSDQDRELWRLSMKDVKPLDQTPLATLSAPQKPTVAQPQKPPGTWDLHGLTLSEAYQLTLREVQQAPASWRYQTFITGKSGRMNQEFSHWLSNNSNVRRIEPLGNGGAYRVWFRNPGKATGRRS